MKSLLLPLGLATAVVVASYMSPSAGAAALLVAHLVLGWRSRGKAWERVLWPVGWCCAWTLATFAGFSYILNAATQGSGKAWVSSLLTTIPHLDLMGWGTRSSLALGLSLALSLLVHAKYFRRSSGDRGLMQLATIVGLPVLVKLLGQGFHWFHLSSSPVEAGLAISVRFLHSQTGIGIWVAFTIGTYLVGKARKRD